MERIYLDNAATTALDPEVLDAMLPLMRDDFGNPSSTHHFGRKTRSAIETARKTIANLLNASPGEIIFTSGGTEADNTAIIRSVIDLGVRHIVSSPLEHHAVLHTIEEAEKQYGVRVTWLDANSNGHLDLTQIEQSLKTNDKTLVSLMHANNEIGNLLPIQKVADMCKANNALFHSDTVQTMGHYSIDTKMIAADFLACGAHKFHGPKGAGFLFKRENLKTHPFIQGGAQERGYRGGTENLYGIIGLAKAFEIAHRDMQKHREHVSGLKKRMIERFKSEIPGVSFNGDAEGESLYTVLNVSFPASDNGEMLLFSLDIAGIAASGGSACSSGSNKGSHVLGALNVDPKRTNVRFSFSKYTSTSDIDKAVDAVKRLIGQSLVHS
ncbi:MAG TPA: cysteine desulfurase [Flavobacteriales bacterium]|nr:cysteine desulfurase [Flavobacteriales bacterium]HRE75069.1 cysteine desulfurase family protein [Flavobacteriales bacterium]HRE98388.1 cysteine desulfurase family protein [Flavobacteriales bacterium]HRJ40190.1 cysteine desulfurase family protein [Flavobacteriales bacterium]